MMYNGKEYILPFKKGQKVAQWLDNALKQEQKPAWQFQNLHLLFLISMYSAEL